MTIQEQKEIERVYQKDISEVDELEIPTYIRNRGDEDDDKNDYSPEYPLGGVLEPYDIRVEDELTV
jgi:hypothetical protein